jgi:hypothetical protein
MKNAPVPPLPCRFDFIFDLETEVAISLGNSVSSHLLGPKEGRLGFAEEALCTLLLINRSSPVPSILILCSFFQPCRGLEGNILRFDECLHDLLRIPYIQFFKEKRELVFQFRPQSG